MRRRGWPARGSQRNERRGAISPCARPLDGRGPRIRRHVPPAVPRPIRSRRRPSRAPKRALPQGRMQRPLWLACNGHSTGRWHRANGSGCSRRRSPRQDPCRPSGPGRRRVGLSGSHRGSCAGPAALRRTSCPPIGQGRRGYGRCPDLPQGRRRQRALPRSTGRRTAGQIPVDAGRGSKAVLDGNEPRVTAQGVFQRGGGGIRCIA